MFLSKDQSLSRPVYMLLGAGGLLGAAFQTKLSGNVERHRIYAFDHSQADIVDPNQINPLLEYVRPTVLINLAAVNDEDICEEAKAGAFKVNCRGPQILAELCKKYGIKLIHFSSATVFDGVRTSPYSEKHPLAPINVHGQSKMSGEIAIKENTDDYLIIRPGWIFNFEGNNCMTQWMDLADKGEDIPVLDDMYGSPTYVPDLVDATLELISRDAKGIFHFANMDCVTMQGFAEAAVALSQTKAKVTPIGRDTQHWFKAPTPSYTALSTKKYSQTTGLEIRRWIDALKQCLFNMNHYKA